MQVLIVDDDCDRQADLNFAFKQVGFQTTATASIAVAESCIRHGLIDLLIMAERVGERLSHSLSLLAEYSNPMVATFILTPRCDTDVDELFLLLPSLHCLLAPDTDPHLITRLAIASVIGAKRTEQPMVLPPECRIEESLDAIPIFSTARRSVMEYRELRQTA